MKKKNPKMVEAGRKAWETRKVNNLKAAKKAANSSGAIGIPVQTITVTLADGTITKVSGPISRVSLAKKMIYKHD